MENSQTRQREIKAKYLQITSFLRTNSPLPGEWGSVFKGSGFDLADIKEFQPGDETKKIHWPSTIRTSRLHIVERVPPRELGVLIILDVSSSMQVPDKFSIALAGAGILAVSALHFGNPVGFIAFSEKIEKELLLSSGENQFSKILGFLLEVEENPTWGKKTDILEPLKRLDQMIFPRKLIFLISDFLVFDLSGFKKFIQRWTGQCDVIPLVIEPAQEYERLKGFRFNFSDAETGRTREVCISQRSAREINASSKKRVGELAELFRSLSLNFAILGESDLLDCFSRLTLCFQTKIRVR